MSATFYKFSREQFLEVLQRLKHNKQLIRELKPKTIDEAIEELERIGGQKITRQWFDIVKKRLEKEVA